jgi:repressor LexA
MNTQKPELTAKQQQVLAAIEDFQSKNDSSPSVRDLAAKLHIKSPNTIFTHLKALQNKGYLEKGLKGKLKNLKKFAEEAANTFQIPLFGEIRAGFQAPADDANRELITIDRYVIRNPHNTFALKVKGNSMENAGIMPGDLILVERRTNARANEIVVAKLPDGFTVKRYMIDNGKPYLQAESKGNYHIELVEGTEVWGVVIGVVRKY